MPLCIKNVLESCIIPTSTKSSAIVWVYITWWPWKPVQLDGHLDWLHFDTYWSLNNCTCLCMKHWHDSVRSRGIKMESIKVAIHLHWFLWPPRYVKLVYWHTLARHASIRVVFLSIVHAQDALVERPVESRAGESSLSRSQGDRTALRVLTIGNHHSETHWTHHELAVLGLMALVIGEACQRGYRVEVEMSGSFPWQFWVL